MAIFIPFPPGFLEESPMGWAPDYCSIAELAEYKRVGDNNDETQMGLAIAAASRAIDRACRRQFGLIDTPAPRIYTARYSTLVGRPVVDIDDLMTVLGLGIAVDAAGDGGFATEVSDYMLGPVNAAADGKPWTWLAGAFPLKPYAVRVTARWGWTAVPDPIKQACLMQASRFLSRRDSPYGIAGSGEGQLRFVTKVDPDVMVALSGYRRYEQGFA